MGKSTISMAIFNSYFDITRGYTSSSSLLPRSSGLGAMEIHVHWENFLPDPPRGSRKTCFFRKKHRVVAILLVGVSVYVTITYYYCTYIYRYKYIIHTYNYIYMVNLLIIPNHFDSFYPNHTTNGNLHPPKRNGMILTIY